MGSSTGGSYIFLSMDDIQFLKSSEDPQLSPFLKNGPTLFISNVTAAIEAVSIAKELLPLTINDKDYGNCFVCSPYGQYVLYGLDALGHKGVFIKSAATAFLAPLGRALKFGSLNRHVSVNNWMMPTNLYPKLAKKDLVKLVEQLLVRYPKHAIVFRSLNRQTNPDLCTWLQELGFSLVASRIIYIFDPLDPKAFSSRMYKSDLKLLEKSDYEILSHKDFSLEDAPRIKELYDALYLTKYSRQNVMWTEAFLRHAIQTEALCLIGLKKQGRLDAVAGFVLRGGEMTAPLFGYDPDVPKQEGLYRLICLLVALEAKKRGVILNQSSGAGSFKKLRRAYPVMEYSAVKSCHLGGYQKVAWSVLGKLLNKVGAPIMHAMER